MMKLQNNPFLVKGYNNSFYYYSQWIILLFSLSSSFSYAQSTPISGLENLHLSEGATMVTVDQGNDTVHYITSTQNIHQKIKTKSSLKKEKITFASHQKKRKAIDEKLIKKIEQKREVKIIYNTDAQSEDLSSNYGTSKSGINNQNQIQKLDKALFTENKPLVFLFIYQEKQNILFLLYHSLKANNRLFTRPPHILFEFFYKNIIIKKRIRFKKMQLMIIKIKK